MCIGHGIHVAARTFVTFVKGCLKCLLLLLLLLVKLLDSPNKLGGSPTGIYLYVSQRWHTAKVSPVPQQRTDRVSNPGSAIYLE